VSLCATPRDALASTATLYGSSRCTELQRCDMAYHLRYERGIAPKRKAAYFDVGSYVHGCLRWVNEAALAGEPLDYRDWRPVIVEARALRHELVTQELAQLPGWDELDPIDEAERLVGAYFALHGRPHWPEAARIVAVEEPLEDAELVATARMDLALDLGGEFIIADTKTRKGSLPENREEFARGLATNEEFLRLSALAQKRYGLAEPPPVWLDAIIKTKVPKVDRLLVRFTQAQIDQWRRNQMLLSAQAWASGDSAFAGRRLPIMNYHECDTPLGRCWAFNWCHGTDESRALHYRGHEGAQSAETSA
jgi:hypothetical protein